MFAELLVIIAYQAQWIEELQEELDQTNYIIDRLLAEKGEPFSSL